jgi:hypothetical protein
MYQIRGEESDFSKWLRSPEGQKELSLSRHQKDKAKKLIERAQEQKKRDY